ncbi:hypothetical protein GE061_001325 [Apolygus lucorum]|uniref:Uncharacterized protein n=1 Tax=Apolygus lucorum TaxID=248454 RepID=A0A8S9Y7Z0_APOLU|nr:hypothetical protein GE061_001325 [Apolygus lucorum]
MSYFNKIFSRRNLGLRVLSDPQRWDPAGQPAAGSTPIPRSDRIYKSLTSTESRIATSTDSPPSTTSSCCGLLLEE